MLDYVCKKQSVRIMTFFCKTLLEGIPLKKGDSKMREGQESLHEDNPKDLRPCNLPGWDPWDCRDMNCEYCLRRNPYVLSRKSQTISDAEPADRGEKNA
jgi:hypothetical protein